MVVIQGEDWQEKQEKAGKTVVISRTAENRTSQRNGMRCKRKVGGWEMVDGEERSDGLNGPALVNPTMARASTSADCAVCYSHVSI